MADIDISLKRYQCMKPPKFKENDLRAFLIEQHSVQPHNAWPTVRALRAKFGGGSSRILRIRRQLEVELGIRPPPTDPALRSRTALARLEHVCDRLQITTAHEGVGTNVIPFPFPYGPSAPSATARRPARVTETRMEMETEQKDSVLRQMTSELAKLTDLVGRMQNDRSRNGAGLALGAVADNLDQLNSAIKRIGTRLDAQQSPPRLGAERDGAAVAALSRLRDEQIAHMQQLADLRRELAQRESRIEALTDRIVDRIDAAANSITGEAGIARHEAALHRLEATTETLASVAAGSESVASSVTTEINLVAVQLQDTVQALQAIPSRAPVTGGKEIVEAVVARVETLLMNGVDAATAEFGGRTADAVKIAVGALGEQMVTQMTVLEKAVGAQRRSGARGLARIEDQIENRIESAIGNLAETVQALGRKRPPRTIRIHTESLAAIDAALGRRLKPAGAKRRRKPASSAARTVNRTRKSPVVVKQRRAKMRKVMSQTSRTAGSARTVKAPKRRTSRPGGPKPKHKAKSKR